nr:auxin response factor 19 [Ipomoea batatas]
MQKRWTYLTYDESYLAVTSDSSIFDGVTRQVKLWQLVYLFNLRVLSVAADLTADMNLRTAAMKTPPPPANSNPPEVEKKSINPELWQACAGPLVNLPTAGRRHRLFHRFMAAITP